MRVKVPLWPLLSLLAVVGCSSPSQPTLELTLTPKAVGDGSPVKLRVTATKADGTIGTGSVSLTSTAGSLRDAQLELDAFGQGQTVLTCNPTVEADCSNSVHVVATWTSSGVSVKAEAVLNASGVPAGTGGGGGSTTTMLVPCSAMDLNFGSAVTLQQPTATFSQTTYGPFTVAKAIDGDVGSSLGWAADQQLTRNQTAAFETAMDTPVQAHGTRLLIQVMHAFVLEHALGRLRISVTTAPRTEFADGNEGITTPGNVGMSDIWTPLTPRRMCASNNSMLRVLGDQSILATDLDSTTVVYALEADTSLNGITGIRLEAMQDPSLPFSGPGCNTMNGNFVVTEFTLRVGDQL